MLGDIIVMLKKITALITLFLPLLLSGCVRISEDLMPYDGDEPYFSSAVTSVVTRDSEPPHETAEEETSAPVTEPPPKLTNNEVVLTADPSGVIGIDGGSGYTEDWDPAFYSNCIFFGDSICRALSVYSDLIDPERVAAAGGCAARNIHEFTFKLNDIDYDISSAAESFQPDMAFLWMGMNDINMTDKNVYAQNLLLIAQEINAVSPDSKVIIIGMSPTASYHEWEANPRIKEYNAAAEEMTENTDLPVYYIDIWDVLSDSRGYLKPEFDGGDGMHLSQRAYYRVLSKIYYTFGGGTAETENTDAS